MRRSSPPERLADMAVVDVTASGRGFEQYGDEVLTSYGHLVKVYESSSAEGPHCWMSVTKGPPVAPGDLPACDVAAHLTYEQAVAIRDRLTRFIDGVPERWGWDA